MEARLTASAMTASGQASAPAQPNLRSRRLGGSVRRMLRHRLIIGNGPPGRAVEIVILAALERPEKSEQPHEAEAERQRHQNDEHFHHDLRCATPRARSAF